MEATSGKTLIQALHEKYSDYNTRSESSLVIVVQVPKTAPGKKSDGSMKIPEELVMSDSAITCAGSDSDLANLCSGIVSLDLEGNKISKFSEVVKILAQTPKCAFLNLRANPLEPINLDDLPSPNNCVVRLVLNEVPLPWQSILLLLKVFPSIAELHLSKIGYCSVDIEGLDPYPSLKVLHFADNAINSWEEVSKLGQLFPNLELLNLLQNPLKNIPLTNDLGKDFQNLKYINLIDAQITQWQELEQFRYFPQLNHIKIVGIPLLEQYPEEIRRMFVIAYLPNLEFLNSGRLTEVERLDAERAFIRHFANIDAKPNRYTELHDIYGDLAPLAHVDLTPSDFEATVTLTCGSKTQLLTVRREWTLTQLRKEIRKVFEIPGSSKFRVFHEQHSWANGAEPMIYPDRTLRRYDVANGDDLHVEMST